MAWLPQGLWNFLQGGSPRLPNLAFGNELRVTSMLSEQNHLFPVIPPQEKFVNEQRESDDVS